MYNVEDKADTRYKFDEYINTVINKHKLFGSYSQTIPSFPTISPVPDNSASSNRKNKKVKSTRGRALYDFRKKQLECEERRVDAINELKEAINEHNKIQKERNEILRNLIESNKRN